MKTSSSLSSIEEEIPGNNIQVYVRVKPHTEDDTKSPSSKKSFSSISSPGGTRNLSSCIYVDKVQRNRIHLFSSRALFLQGIVSPLFYVVVIISQIIYFNMTH